MPRSLTAVRLWALVHPKTHQGTSWAGRCEQFVNNAGGFNEAFASATIAGNNSGTLHTNWRDAPKGAIHYWTGGGAGNPGHDAFELGGGTLLMASTAIGNASSLGKITFARYAQLRPSMRYRGWSLRHGSETLARLSTESLGTSPARPPLLPTEDEMKFVYTNEAIAPSHTKIKRYYLITSNGVKDINPGHIKRLTAIFGKPKGHQEATIDVVRRELAA